MVQSCGTRRTKRRDASHAIALRESRPWRCDAAFLLRFVTTFVVANERCNARVSRSIGLGAAENREKILAAFGELPAGTLRFHRSDLQVRGFRIELDDFGKPRAIRFSDHRRDR